MRYVVLRCGGWQIRWVQMRSDDAGMLQKAATEGAAGTRPALPYTVSARAYVIGLGVHGRGLRGPNRNQETVSEPSRSNASADRGVVGLWEPLAARAT